VLLFGSSVSELCEDRSDLDLTLRFDIPGEVSEFVETIGKLFERGQTALFVIVPHGDELLRAEFKEVLALPKARVPIVKFLVPSA
jgi:hypothetical protein